ncbi:MAG: hypothetical protein ABJO02_00745 [Reichenbachiella sp.]|uniref:toxin-antitoxin system YwqK family antitoxin n=1 Tax=Reichenbachiella sp. TaxID=2184521 RepID=UPI00329A36CE
MKYYLLFLLAMSVVACDSTLDESQATNLKKQIPKVELLESDSRLSRANDGTIYLDTTAYSGYLISFYSDSTIKSKKTYYQGKLEGDFVSYYSNGQVSSLRPYHFGEKHGEHLGYYKNGKLQFQYFFEHGFGQGTHKTWYPNGDLKMEMNYVDGKERGLQRVWRTDGKMRSNYVVRENGRKYGKLGLKRCAKIDSETGDVDPYKGNL